MYVKLTVIIGYTGDIVTMHYTVSLTIHSAATLFNDCSVEITLALHLLDREHLSRVKRRFTDQLLSL